MSRLFHNPHLTKRCTVIEASDSVYFRVAITADTGSMYARFPMCCLQCSKLAGIAESCDRGPLPLSQYQGLATDVWLWGGHNVLLCLFKVSKATGFGPYWSKLGLWVRQNWKRGHVVIEIYWPSGMQKWASKFKHFLLMILALLTKLLLKSNVRTIFTYMLIFTIDCCWFF